ncbi:hypothetical protein CDAR_47081 [Caerostris darwini]|uniref:Uncharacterized protein n=1 Tax=Caerostris darwini TaxID=1538125 RepID=A0AAV4U9X9_9ARAC|nr:hypothetical protein CDAR_47081 [Caerostris darwini]
MKLPLLPNDTKKVSLRGDGFFQNRFTLPLKASLESSTIAFNTIARSIRISFPQLPTSRSLSSHESGGGRDLVRIPFYRKMHAVHGLRLLLCEREGRFIRVSQGREQDK